METRLFTLSEANNLIPELETALRKIQAVRAFLQSIQVEIQKARDHASGGGGSPIGPSYIKGLEFIVSRIEKIQESGVVLKDLERGLCDFPALRDGDQVYLCWKLGEPEIRWWHPLDSGFSGRQPLEPESV